MARKRDYKAEEARRNALARERGYTSRASLRRAIETGKASPIAPERVRSPRTIAAQERRLAATTAGRDAESAFLRATGSISPRDRAEDWSGIFARSKSAEYAPENAKDLGVTRAEYTRAYLDAFVMGDTRYTAVRHKGGSPALFYWFVTLNGYMSADEYESRYGPATD